MTPLAAWWTVLPPRALTVLAAPPPAAPPGAERGEEFGKTSPIALVVILLLGLATALLIRSMSKHLRTVPASFDPPEQSDARVNERDGPAAESPRAPGTTEGAGTEQAAGTARAPTAPDGGDIGERPPGTGSS